MWALYITIKLDVCSVEQLLCRPLCQHNKTDWGNLSKKGGKTLANVT